MTEWKVRGKDDPPGPIEEAFSLIVNHPKLRRWFENQPAQNKEMIETFVRWMCATAMELDLSNSEDVQKIRQATRDRLKSFLREDYDGN